MRISGLVKAANGVRDRLRRGIPPSGRDDFRTHVRDLVERVEMLCDENFAEPADLPGPSRKAYEFLRNLDLDDLPEATEEPDDAARPSKIRISGVVGAAQRLAGRLWNESARILGDEEARASIREAAASHVAAIEAAAEELDSDPTALPDRSRRHFAWLKWLTQPGNAERQAAALSRISWVLGSPAGRRLLVSMLPMSGIYSLRRRGPRLVLRISPALMAASDGVLDALARAIADAPDAAEARAALRLFAGTPPAVAVEREIDSLAAPAHPTAGRVHDLATSFSRVNLRMFKGALSAPVLRWSRQITGHVFGRYVRERDEIVISQSLDDPEVPPEIVDSIVYHELLHRELGISAQNGRLDVHSEEFRRRERMFPGADRAEAFLTAFARRLRGG